MKRMIGLILFLFIVFSAISAASATQLGNTTYGYVDKDIYGNNSSNETIPIIVGVHPQENGIHNAITNELTNKSENLTKRYVLYSVHVTQDVDDYSKGRMNGQLLAQQFIVPDISRDNTTLVIDAHENHYKDSGYDYARFLYLISSDSKTAAYAQEIIDQMPFLVTYSPPNPTSTKYVTIPIADKGIPTMVYETYMYDSVSKKASDASALINALDTKVADPNKNYDLAITAVPKGGNYYAPPNVTLTANQTSNIYYTQDGSIPTENSTPYSGSINITNSTVLKFFAVDADGKHSQIFTENYFIYAWTPYTYQVTVQYRLSNKKYRIKYTVPYTAKKRIRTKVGKKWKYSYVYVTKYKIKYKWDYKYGYRVETRNGYRWQLI